MTTGLPRQEREAREIESLAPAFRSYVIGLPPGSPFEWCDMDAWAKAHCPKSARQGPEPTFQPCDDLTTACTGICEELEEVGWVRKANLRW
jgi:hypothetical protein